MQFLSPITFYKFYCIKGNHLYQVQLLDNMPVCHVCRSTRRQMSGQALAAAAAAGSKSPPYVSGAQAATIRVPQQQCIQKSSYCRPEALGELGGFQQPCNRDASCWPAGSEFDLSAFERINAVGVFILGQQFLQQDRTMVQFVPSVTLIRFQNIVPSVTLIRFSKRRSLGTCGSLVLFSLFIFLECDVCNEWGRCCSSTHLCFFFPCFCWFCDIPLFKRAIPRFHARAMRSRKGKHRK